MAIVAASGPAVNLLLFYLCRLAIRLLYGTRPTCDAGDDRCIFVWLLLDFTCIINITLCVSNLIPIDPMDGGRVIKGLLLCIGVPRRLVSCGVVVVRNRSSPALSFDCWHVESIRTETKLAVRKRNYCPAQISLTLMGALLVLDVEEHDPLFILTLLFGIGVLLYSIKVSLQ